MMWLYAEGPAEVRTSYVLLTFSIRLMEAIIHNKTCARLAPVPVSPAYDRTTTLTDKTVAADYSGARLARRLQPGCRTLC
jgi:hypothetical protein